MKSRFAFALLLLIPFFAIKAQKPIIVSEDSLKIGNSILPGLSVTIPEVNYDKALKVWIRDLQFGTKSKVVTENNEMSIFGAKIKMISPNPVNVFSKLVSLDSSLQLFACFEKKKDVYVERSSGEADYTKAQEYLKEFAKGQYIEVAKDKADAEEKKLRDLQKELNSLENEKSRLQRSIQSDNASILSEKDNITIQNNELNTVSAALIEQNNLLATIEAGPAQKEKTDQIKELEKRKKKALNSIEASENRINRANSDIDKSNHDIPRNERMQERVREQIILQEAVYQKYADKLKKIKAY
jgi:peptidoglycan hydrolase CwlO-like protein